MEVAVGRVVTQNIKHGVEYVFLVRKNLIFQIS